MQRYIVRSSTSYVPRLTRAFAQKVQSRNDGDQKFNIGATFPDDFEDSPLKSEILEKRNRNRGIDDSYHPTMDEIIESLRGKPAPHRAKTAKSAQTKRDPVREEREPEIDEM
ncbi:hypothetical protein PENNAL_c0020G04058 [Penicillium nalgiovense]|uniref:Uncharacterized protein n=1 Tax=Penicillium nalgiovense TaxID=60175 RepID=A0A1V6YI74_PENNA|nr:hypothetical protein PENNAL_c0020G04058 [Penicillium nalgiovense]